MASGNDQVPDAPRHTWTLLTNHASVLIEMNEKPDILIRELAQEVGITERATQSILHDLVQEGYVVVQKHGRRNSYRVVLDARLRHPLHQHVTVAQLVEALSAIPQPERRRRR